MKKFTKWLCIVLIIAVLAVVLFFVNAFFGNPISKNIARINASRYLEDNFGDSHYRISNVGHDIKTGGYYAFVDSPTSRDSYFTIFFDEWGRYYGDTYEDVTSKYTTLSRINDQYWDLVRDNATDRNSRFDISIYFGDVRITGVKEIYTYTDENGETIEYTLDKDYGFDRSLLELDKEYDIRQIGRDCGSICLYIHDPDVTVNRAAELLLEMKAYLDEKNIPFHAIDFHLCEPRNEEGQLVGEQITLYDFLYSDIYEEALVDRVREHWEMAQEHHAIQDGLKNEIEHISSTVDDHTQ